MVGNRVYYADTTEEWANMIYIAWLDKDPDYTKYIREKYDWALLCSEFEGVLKNVIKKYS